MQVASSRGGRHSMCLKATEESVHGSCPLPPVYTPGRADRTTMSLSILRQGVREVAERFNGEQSKQEVWGAFGHCPATRKGNWLWLALSPQRTLAPSPGPHLNVWEGLEVPPTASIWTPRKWPREVAGPAWPGALSGASEPQSCH